MSAVLDQARALAAAGVSSVPIMADGTKRPLTRWSAYQERIPTPDEMARLYRPGCGLAVIGGVVSGNLEILDFDEPALLRPWRARVDQIAPGLVLRLPVVRTPSGGAHYYYRHAGTPDGNQKLAQELRAGTDGHARPYTLVETRGDGGYAIAPPSPAACHPARRAYTLLRGSLTAPPTIGGAARRVLLDAARGLGTYTAPAAPAPHPSAAEAAGGRPGDAFNARADWTALLQPHGWRVVHRHGDETIWRRPGKDEGQSATTGHDGHNVLFVFTSNAWPFELGRGYTPFTAYALLEHNGDFHAAAQALAAQGDSDGDTARRVEDDLPAPRYVGAWRRRIAAVGMEIGASA